MTGPDVIVIGAGVNGLATAAVLARAGRKVILVERRDRVGGLSASEAFHPGFRTGGVLPDTTAVRPALLDTLELARHGLVREAEPPSIFLPEVGASGLLLHHDPTRAAEELRVHSERDAVRYREYREFFARIRGVVERVLNEPPPALDAASMRTKWDLLRTGLAVKRLGKNDMLELLRVGPMCVADWVGEWFETPALKAGIAAPAVASTFAGPWSPGTAANLLVSESLARGAIRGGPAALVAALEAAARAAGVEIRTGAAVERILVSGSRVGGVRLAGGEEIASGTVAAASDSRHTILDLIEPREITHRLDHGIRNVRGHGLTAVLHLAVRGDLEPKGRSGDGIARWRLAGTDLDALEKTFDPVKYETFGTRQALEVWVPSRENPDLAPPGHQVVSVLATGVPYRLQDGWTDAARDRLADQTVAALAVHVPDLPSRILGRELLAPPDLEVRYGVVEGHLYHGDHALDQLLFRPTADCARYRTPIEGLFLCGSGSFPGGGVTGAPGLLAARAILGR